MFPTSAIVLILASLKDYWFLR